MASARLSCGIAVVAGVSSVSCHMPSSILSCEILSQAVSMDKRISKENRDRDDRIRFMGMVRNAW